MTAAPNQSQPGSDDVPSRQFYDGSAGAEFLSPTDRGPALFQYRYQHGPWQDAGEDYYNFCRKERERGNLNFETRALCECSTPVPCDGEADPLADLVERFSRRLLAKLRLAKANGRSGWERDDWEAACQQGLLRHLEKGDPRDVAAYCAFMDHHGWITKPATPPAHSDAPAYRMDIFEAAKRASAKCPDTAPGKRWLEAFRAELPDVANTMDILTARSAVTEAAAAITHDTAISHSIANRFTEIMGAKIDAAEMYPRCDAGSAPLRLPTPAQIEPILDDFLGVDSPHYEELRKRCAQRIFDLCVVMSGIPIGESDNRISPVSSAEGNTP